MNINSNQNTDHEAKMETLCEAFNALSATSVTPSCAYAAVTFAVKNVKFAPEQFAKPWITFLHSELMRKMDERCAASGHSAYYNDPTTVFLTEEEKNNFMITNSLELPSIPVCWIRKRPRALNKNGTYINGFLGAPVWKNINNFNSCFYV